MDPRQPTALAQALLVTFLWASSWVLITIGLRDLALPALPFAGLRYAVAALLLVAVALSRSGVRTELRGASATTWRWILALGVVTYALTQGAQFVALSYLPAASVSLVLSFTPVIVALAAVAALDERLLPTAWVGLTLACVGGVWYSSASGGADLAGIGVLVAVVGLVANAAGALMGRAVNRRGHLSPLAVTAPSMAVGAALLLAVGLPLQGWPSMPWEAWAIVGWLAVVNTAFAFTLWNHTMRVLPAALSSTVNNTMLVQIAVLAWLFLDQPLTGVQVTAVVAVSIGTALVSLRRRSRPVER